MTPSRTRAEICAAVLDELADAEHLGSEDSIQVFNAFDSASCLLTGDFAADFNRLWDEEEAKDEHAAVSEASLALAEQFLGDIPDCGEPPVDDIRLQIIRDYVSEVNRRAEENMLKTGKLEGAHHAAMKQVLAEIEKGQDDDSN